MTSAPSSACLNEPRHFLRDTAWVFLGNTAIALFMTAVRIENFWPNFIYSQCIGLSIAAAISGLCVLRRRTRPGLTETAAGIPLGGFVGFVLGTWGNGLSLAEVAECYPHAMAVSAAGAVFFGAIAAYYFHAHTRLNDAVTEARDEKLRRMEQESLAARAELRLLQARIEPHFLFNTLSNVVGLIEQDPPAARAMLLDLTTLLRTSLARTRREEAALAEELDLLRAYLGIMGRRMGERLVWRIDAAPAVLDARLPPLLLQPLVENAIRHGLEPKPEGGELVITCRRLDNHAVITVADSGLGLGSGLGGAHAGSGVGLANVRARLAACYGATATLELAENPGGGVTARLSIPLENHAPADR